MEVGWRPEWAPFQNEILATLPPKDIERLRPHLSRVTLVSGQVLHEHGNLIEDVFFIEAGIASLTADTMDNGAVEVGLTGREGLVGVTALLNPEALAIHRAFVQVPGGVSHESDHPPRSGRAIPRPPRPLPSVHSMDAGADLASGRVQCSS